MWFMEVDISRRMFILRKEYLFQGLDTTQLARVAGLFDPVEYQPGETIFLEDDQAEHFYIILEGRVRITRRKSGRQKLLNILGPGDYFGELALLFYGPRTASAKAETYVVLLRLAQEPFQDFLKDYPQIRLNLVATAKGRRLVRGLHFDWLADEEVVYYITRRHSFFLYLALIGPAAVALGVLFVWLLISTTGGIAGMEIGTVILLVPFILALGWAGWSWLDWSNDYYVVTNRRVVWQEKIVLIYDSRREAPLNSVLTVNTTTSLLGRMLNYGTVEVRTYTGTMSLRQMNKPSLFASFVEGYKKRVLAYSQEQEAKEMEESISTALRKSMEKPNTEAVAAPVAPAAKVPPKKRGEVSESLRNFMRTFLKVRYQEGKIITYRKHWLLLVTQAWLPLLFTFATLAGLVWSIFARQFIFAAVAFLVLLGFFVWLAYEYMDWSNDIYRLTPDQILDIEKKPLGREQKRTANLDAPDFRVEHLRANIINIIFNYGNVTVSIGQTQFTFDGVYNPDQVHQDVADYREALLRRKRDDESKRERERMVNWLVAYHNQTDKLENQENTAE